MLADQFHAKTSEIRRFLSGQLDGGRTLELADRMRAVGLALWEAASVRTASVSVSVMWARSHEMWAEAEIGFVLVEGGVANAEVMLVETVAGSSRRSAA